MLSNYLNKCILADFFAVLPEVPARSIHFIFADLPYGISGNKWETKIDLNKMWKLFHRVLVKNGVIACTAAQPFTTTLISSNKEKFLYRWVWDRGGSPSNFQTAKVQPMRYTEDILIFSDGRAASNAKLKARYFPIMTSGVTVSSGGIPSQTDFLHANSMVALKKTYKTRYPGDLIVFEKDATQGRIHSTQKPISLLEYLIKTYSKEDEIVLDPVAGSGTTGVAAINTNRNFILLEKDPDIFLKMQERVIYHATTRTI